MLPWAHVAKVCVESTQARSAGEDFVLNQHKVFSAGVHGERLVHVLSGRYLATLATRNGDGSIHQAVVWFLESDGAILIATSAATRKAQNAARDPAASVLIDTRGSGELRGVAASGSIEIVRGDEARALNETVWSKYLTDQGLEDPEVGGVIRANDDITLHFCPDLPWRTWGTDSDFGGAFGRPGTSYSLDA